jgi:N-acetylglucosaminyldiphosphoundecaprenol N-acetyl-beta-D-mannosaminyltransferase
MSSEPSAPRARERVLGHPVHALSRDDAARLVVARALDDGPGTYVCLTNVHTTVESQRSGALRRAADQAFLSVPDGIPLVWILRRRGFRDTEKVTGIELIPMVAAAGREHGLRHAFYGGGPGVAQAAGERMLQIVPHAQVVAAVSPPFGSFGEREVEELRSVVEDTRPHVLWVGLGAPKQDLFMARAAHRVGVPVMIGVGAAFDYMAGTKRPAPTWMRHGGLEWLFRLVSEPRRLWRRYVIGNTLFVYLLAREALGLPANGRPSKG